MAHGIVLTLNAAYAALAHGFGLADMCLDKAAVALEKDAHTQKKHRHTYYNDAKDEQFEHFYLSLYLVSDTKVMLNILMHQKRTIYLTFFLRKCSYSNKSILI